MFACINNFFCGAFQQTAQPSFSQVNPAMSSRTYARAPKPLDFPVTPYWATAARSSSTASRYSELAEMRVVLDRSQAARTRSRPADNGVLHQATASLAPSQSTLRTTHYAPAVPQANRARIQPNSHHSAPYWTTVPAAPPHIQFRTTSSGIRYSTQPAVNSGLGNFYQINCTPQIIHRDYRGEVQRTAHPSFPTMINPTMPPRTYAQAAPLPDLLATRYRETAQPYSIFSGTHRSAVVPQAVRTRSQTTYHQSAPHRTVDQTRASMTLQHTVNTPHQTTSSRHSIFSDDYWKSFKNEVGSAGFHTLLRRLQEHHRTHPLDQVPRRLTAIYQAMSHNPELVRALYDEAQIGAESCSDRAAASLNRLETRCAIEQSIQGKEMDDRALLTILRGLFRQEQLYKIAEHKVAQQEAQQRLPAAQRRSLDPVETHLFYQIALKERLQLPGETRSMTFGTIAGVTQEEGQRAGDKILRIEKLDPNSLINFIADNEHWQRYLQQHYQSRHDCDDSIAHYETRMEQLEEASEQQQISGEEYRQRCHQLMQERQTASKDWYRAKSHELIHKHLLT